MEPKIGMRYDDCAKRIKRIARNGGHPQAKRNLINSLVYQCRLHEGESSLTELAHDCASIKLDSIFSGGGNKQIGYGPGYKLGDGRWIRTGSGSWERA
jgi:hypothetical protein